MVILLSNKAVIWITYLNIGLFAYNHWMQENAVPFLIKKFGAKPIVYGELQMMYAVVQLIGSPLMGRLGDLIGAKKVMLLSHLSILVSYLIVGAGTKSISSLYLSRIPFIFRHTYQSGMKLVTDLAPLGKRLSALSKLGMSYAVGMVIGNAVSGFAIERFDEQVAALIAAVGVCVNLIIVLVFLPSHSEEREMKAVAHSEQRDPNSTSLRPNIGDCGARHRSVLRVLQELMNWRSAAQVLRNRNTRLLLLLKLVIFMPIVIIQSVFPIVAINQFKADPMSMGFMTAYIAITSLIVQAVVLPSMGNHFSERFILHLFLFILGGSFLILTQATHLTTMILVVLPMETSITVINVVIYSMLTKSVVAEEIGTILGISTSVGNVIAIFAPLIANIILSACGYYAIAWLGAVISAASLVCALHAF